MLTKISDLLENEKCELELEPYTDKDGVDWVYIKMEGCRSVRIRENGFWEQSGRMGRFGKAPFKEAIKTVLHIFHCVEAKRKFVKDAKLGRCDNRELINLNAAGWRESCLSRTAWHFDHPDFPDVRVMWRHAYLDSESSIEVQ